MKIHAGDSVLVIAGKDRGKQGTVLRVLLEKNRLIVEGINMRIRHIRKTREQPGQRIKYEASLASSNVMLLDPKTKKPTRIGYRVDPVTGKKVRYAKVSGEVLPVRSTTKAVERKSQKKQESTKSTKSATSEGTTSSEPSASSDSSASSPPKRQPFWKRAFSSAPQAEEGKGSTRSGVEEAGHGPTAPVRRSRESS